MLNVQELTHEGPSSSRETGGGALTGSACEQHAARGTAEADLGRDRTGAYGGVGRRGSGEGGPPASPAAANAFTHVWFWRARLPGRKGQRCRVLWTGTLNSILVEFADGLRVVTSRYAVRRAT